MSPALAKQIFQYGTVGVIALGVDVGIFLAVRSLGLDLVPANIIARFAGAVAAYSGNYIWTFSQPRKLSGWVSSSWRYALTWVGATLLSTSLLGTLTNFGAHEAGSKLAVELMMPLLNFFVVRRWVFK